MSLARRPVRVRLRGHRNLSGRIHIAEGEPLTRFLGSKGLFLNLTEVEWEGRRDERMPHLSVRLDEVTWVEPREPDLRLTTAVPPDEEGRRVELLVDDDLRLQVRIKLAPETRMSDYLESSPSFLPLWSVELQGRSDVATAIALNRTAIHVVRELDETDPGGRN